VHLSEESLRPGHQVHALGGGGRAEPSGRDPRWHDAREPVQNILGGAYYLRNLADRFEGDLYFTLAAYNAGPMAVRRYRGVPPYPETESYVRQVLTYYWRSLPAAQVSSGS